VFKTFKKRPGFFKSYLSAGGAYNNYEECLSDRYQVLTQSRYDRVREAYTAEEAAKMLYACGYPTDSGYPEKLIGIINQYNLKKFDQLKKQPNNGR